MTVNWFSVMKIIAAAPSPVMCNWDFSCSVSSKIMNTVLLSTCADQAYNLNYFNTYVRTEWERV